MKKILKIMALVTLLVSIAACSSHRSATSDATGRVPARRISEVADLASTYTQWQTLYAPVSVRCSRPFSISLSGRATMQRDSFIYLSMRMIGFEVAVLYVDTDSAVAIDKYHKIVASVPLSDITARTGLTLGDIQDVLLGRAFYPGRGTLCSIGGVESLFSADNSDPDMMVLMPRRLPEGAQWWFTVDHSPALRRLTVEPDGHSPFVIEYADAVAETPGGTVASFVNLTGAVGNRAIEASIQWNLGKAKWNEPVERPSLSYKGYRRLSADELISSLRF